MIIGIDLGTTNTAVATADPAAREPRVDAFAVPQLVAEGEVGARRTLPSFLYLAGEHDLPEAATRVPWRADPRIVVGELARAQGARVPGRMIASAKSWLCHPGVDRQAAILPWGAGDVPKLSPVDASARILAHLAAVRPMAGDEVIVTVPASFDEVARELTVAAAERAGLPQITLLEEPQAVFYAWIDATPPAARKKLLAPGERVLVCDVGGGTTDFTLIDVAEDGDHFARTAVGDHLLLGGDNVDIALARRVEARLAGKLDAVQWHGLVHACRLAKEALLSPDAPAARPIAVQARGARLVGGTLRAEVTREEVMELCLDGFFPLVPRDARPARARAGLHELGLPYAADAAVTRHLAAFLDRHHATRVAAVLFNGGAMTPSAVRDRVLDQLAAWQGDRPRELAGVAPELAVAHGAAYYGLVRHGLGSRIRGGAARAYYVGVESSAVCVLPRGAEEGTENELAQDFAALTNRPASFRLYSSSVRDDRPGDEVSPDDLVELPPLVTVLRAPGLKQARVRVTARLTELGTLEVWCVSGDHRWRLSFDLRSGGAPPAGDALPPNVDELRGAVAAALAGGDLDGLMKDLEARTERRRDEWGTALIRALWDTTFEAEGARHKTADAESRWLNLAGFFLRPGAGAPLDDWRVGQMWRTFNAGLVHDRDEGCRLAWWITWRRIAAGLKRTQQDQFYDRLSVILVPGAPKKGKPVRAKPSPQEAAEMWRTLASMERILPSSKVKLGEAILERIDKGKDTDFGFWAVGRLGARQPLYGPADAVIAPAVAEAWIDRLLALEWKTPEKVAFPAAQLGRRTGDRARDIDDDVRERLAARLRSLPGLERTARLVEEVVALEAREEKVAFGDSLPAGLRKLPTE